MLHLGSAVCTAKCSTLPIFAEIKNKKKKDNSGWLHLSVQKSILEDLVDIESNT